MRIHSFITPYGFLGRKGLSFNECSVDGIMAHPDDHNGLLDWPTFGPRNPEIGQLVAELAYAQGLRLAEIEDLIVDGLRLRLSELSAKPLDPHSSKA